MYIPSLPKHNLLMQQRVFSLQIEDTLQIASNQTGDDNENSSKDEWLHGWLYVATLQQCLLTHTNVRNGIFAF